jgi:hypothetical protein
MWPFTKKRSPSLPPTTDVLFKITSNDFFLRLNASLDTRRSKSERAWWRVYLTQRSGVLERQ